MNFKTIVEQPKREKFNYKQLKISSRKLSFFINVTTSSKCNTISLKVFITFDHNFFNK